MAFGKRKRDREAQQEPATGATVPGTEGLPDSVQQVLGQLPTAFQQSLGQAPPEVMQQLAAFGQSMPGTAPQPAAPQPGATAEGTTIPVTPGMDLAQALSAAGVANPEQVLGQIPPSVLDNATVQGIEVGPEQVFSFSSVQVTGPVGKYSAEFSQPHYGPGDTVEGVLVANEYQKAREVNLALAYVQQSPGYVEATEYGQHDNAHRGHVEAGARIPFSFHIPHDALPNWDPAGIAAAQAGGGSAVGVGLGGAIGLAGYGRLYWGIQATMTRRGMIAHDVEYVPVPVDPDPSRWPGPAAPSGPFEVSEKVKGWDVDLNVDPWAPQRGEEVRVDVSLGHTTEGRGEVRVGLIGEIHYDAVSRSTDNDGNSTSSRSTEIATIHDEWQVVDASQPLHQVRFTIPDAAPFSYGRPKGKKMGSFTWSTSGGKGSCFAITWRVAVTEDRRMRRDPRRDAIVVVRP